MEKLKELLEKHGCPRWECVSFEKVKSMPGDMWALHDKDDVHEKQKGNIAGSIKGIDGLSDAPFDDSNWREEPVMAAECEDCDICIHACPNGSISKDRFLFYREKCKGCKTECYWSCPLNIRDSG